MLEATNFEAGLNDASEREKSTTTLAVTRPFRGRQRVASVSSPQLAQALNISIRIGTHRSCGNLITVQEVIIHTIYTSTLPID